MIQKFSILNTSDKCGVWAVGVFHLYKGFNRKSSTSGEFLKVSTKKVKPNNWVIKGSKHKSILNLVKKNKNKNDGSGFKLKINSCVLLKKRITPKGKELFGPTTFNIRRKKFINSFVGIL